MARTEEPIRLIVGLGNPGQEYAATRHNAGQWFIDALLRRHPAPVPLQNESKFRGQLGQTIIGNRNVRLLVPSTYMNLSGECVAAVANFYKIEPEEILVAHDELDIAPGTARLKMGGGHGGHNGLRDIIKCLGNQKNFGRLRIGIGHPGNPGKVTSFVLKKAPAAEQELIEKAIDAAVAEMERVVSGQWQQAMNTLHAFDAGKPEAQQAGVKNPGQADNKAPGTSTDTTGNQGDGI